MKILIINGPNLNLLGKREPEIYGNQSFEDYFSQLQFQLKYVELSYFQSNHEGDLIDKLQDSVEKFEANVGKISVQEEANHFPLNFGGTVGEA